MWIKKRIKELLRLKMPSIYKLIQLRYHYKLMKEVELDPTVFISFPFDAHNSMVGRYTYLSRNCTLCNTTVGNFCSIGPNLISGWGIHPTDSLSTHPMFYSTRCQNGFTLSSTNKIQEYKNITIGNDVFIGMNVTILDGVVIGDGAIIGAGSVVSKDIPPYAIAVGNPIRVLRYRFDDETIESLLKIAWWNWTNVDKVEKYFSDVNGFIFDNKK